MRLNELRDHLLARKRRKRVGRGIGSGHGKTSGRGQKGQQSRSGVAIKGFEGGQMPLHRRLPKRGFKGKPDKTKPCPINLGEIQALIDSGKLPVDRELSSSDIIALRSAPSGAIKLLSDGDLSFPLRIRVHYASVRAIAKVRAAGGVVQLEPTSSGGNHMILKGELKQDAEGGLSVDVNVRIDENEFADVDLGDFRIVIHPRNASFAQKTFTLDDLPAKDRLTRRDNIFTRRFRGHTTDANPIVALYLLYKNRLLCSENLVADHVRRLPIPTA